jgi:CheY-like chemotaxis protein
MLTMKRALACDQNQDILYLVTFVLTNIGWEVITSADCENIIGKVQQFKPSVILMDNDFPKDAGLITIQNLKKDPHFKHIPVILLSSSNNISGMAERAGTKFCLPKPFDFKKLENIVTEAYEEFKSNGPSEVSGAE